jgi:hypothetical protein
LDNLEFRKISKDFSMFLGPPPFFYGLEVFFGGSLKGLLLDLCFRYNCNVFFAL